LVSTSFPLASAPASGYPLVVVSRRDFDSALLQAAISAGATLVPERVLDVGADGDGVQVRTSEGVHRAGVLVGADGANSLVRRRLLQPFTRSQLSIATGYYAHGVTSRSITIRCVDRPAGYLWSFPRADHLAVGMCAQADRAGATELRQVAAGWITEANLGASAKLEPYSWPIPSLRARDFATERPAGRRFLLVGDAAGLVDSLTREGIFFALRSAELAARALSGDRGTEEYAERVRAELFPELRRAASLKAGFFNGPFTRLLVEALDRSDPVRQVMIDLLGGCQPYRTLPWRLLRTFEFGLAWRLLNLEITGRRA
jgi:flavin-dependent dehydrogenase